MSRHERVWSSSDRAADGADISAPGNAGRGPEADHEDHTSHFASGALRALPRRTFLGSVAAFAVAPAPGSVRPARANGPTLRVLCWPEYLPDELLKPFTETTGIPVEVTVVNSNEAFANKLGSDNQQDTFDICAPSSVRALDWQSSGLLQPWDLERIAGTEHINPLMLHFAAQHWRLDGTDPHWLPYTWGAEAIGWRTDKYNLRGERPSFGDVWDPVGVSSGDVPRVMVSPHSGIVGAALYLEEIGQLPAGSTWATYQAKDDMLPVFEQVTRWCIYRQRSLRMKFWNDENSQREGFVNDAVSIGQTWDRPTVELLQQGLPIAFQAPREGALVWQNGFSLVAKSKKVEAAHALMGYLCDPQVAGTAINTHGFHSAIVGAEQHANDVYRAQFAASFPGSAVHELNLWPPEPEWYVEQRVEFRNRLLAAVEA